MAKRTYQLLLEHWGQSIRSLRGSRSQTWLARRAGVDQTVISRIERGIYKLSAEQMVDIAAALEVELGDLFSFPPGLVSREIFERELRSLKRGAAA